ncbi:hypothetical protein L227DRAFT_205888 [Lentinus tigrinus ALCF2SS1-6]|uniref:Secreted protein n=1 Tax=Lentinus tigrinus ALCF2SS1-6 TaxID=1328759 RepID=A0A5C2SPH6_9APHY|nr:hypothetical protein L227DRAFT_205888 [Lentinus tigrinus ALCF2SS1-6]
MWQRRHKCFCSSSSSFVFVVALCGARECSRDVLVQRHGREGRWWGVRRHEFSHDARCTSAGTTRKKYQHFRWHTCTTTRREFRRFAPLFYVVLWYTPFG